MRCASARNHFDELHDGRLEAGVRQRVEEHLAACAACAGSYETMRRILDGVRRMPRPGVPHLEVSPPEGLIPEPGAVPLRRRHPMRVAAAAGLLLALVVTHVLAYWLGDHRNRELAGIAREDLPRLADAHFGRTASQLRVARALADEDPAAAARLALRDPVADDLRRKSHAFLRVSDEPGLRSIRDRLARFVRMQDEVFAASDLSRVRGAIPRLERELNELIRVFQKQTALKHVAALPRNADEAIRTGRRLLVAGRPADASKFMARYFLESGDASLARGQLSILLESSVQVGEMRELEAVQRLVRVTGAGGLRVYFGRGDGGTPRPGGTSVTSRVITFRMGPRGRPVVVPIRRSDFLAEWADMMRGISRR